MAGEVIEKIRDKEKEGAQIIEKAKLKAKKIIEGAKERKKLFFAEKDELLKKEDKKISKRYQRETEDAIKELENEKERNLRMANLIGFNLETKLESKELVI